jgi:DNA repair exonuclease SbcCD nuclease subunit
MIKKIYHFSDVHCRLYTRHQEYREVFGRLFAEIRKRGVDNAIICITGDVAHMKNDISPELSDLMSELFHGCAELCPTYVFPGNHDFNEANRDKMDAITPVANAMKNPRLKYVRDSEVIVHDDIVISHMSIWDGPDNWKLSPDVPNAKRKIATYHGTVEGCITEIGFAGFSKQLPLSTFDGFDVVLLGDVHKLSYFGDKQNMAYPSSLIQQDYGEHPDEHGFLEWDLDTCKATFIPVHNDYSMRTIKIDSGVTLNDVKNISGITPKTSVRIIYDHVSEVSEKEFSDTIMSYFSLPSIKVDRIKPKVIGIGDVTEAHVESAFTGWGIDKQMEMFREFYQVNSMNVSDNVMEEIRKIHSDLLSKTADGEHITRGVTWTPVSFEFSNMFSYGEGNGLDFSGMTDLVGLFAPNRSGKSNLLDSVLYTVHDKCTRTSLAANVMNKDSSTFSGTFTFKIGDDLYSISRTGTRGIRVRFPLRLNL